MRNLESISDVMNIDFNEQLNETEYKQICKTFQTNYRYVNASMEGVCRLNEKYENQISSLNSKNSYLKTRFMYFKKELLNKLKTKLTLSERINGKLNIENYKSFKLDEDNI